VPVRVLEECVEPVLVEPIIFPGIAGAERDREKLEQRVVSDLSSAV
jgi:hypothetical protein